MCWPLSDGLSTLLAIDEQPDDQIVHPFRLNWLRVFEID